MYNKIKDIDDLSLILNVLTGLADLHTPGEIGDALVKYGGLGKDSIPQDSTVKTWLTSGAERMSNGNFQAFIRMLIEMGTISPRDEVYNHMWFLKRGSLRAAAFTREQSFTSRINHLRQVQNGIEENMKNPPSRPIENAVLWTQSSELSESLREDILGGEDITPHLTAFATLVQVKVWSDANEVSAKSPILPLAYAVFQSIVDFSKPDAIQFSSYLGDLYYLSGDDVIATSIFKRLREEGERLDGDERVKTAMLGAGDYLMHKTEMKVSTLSDMADDSHELDLMYKYGGADRCKACRYVGMDNSIARHHIDEGRKKTPRLRAVGRDPTILDAYLDTLELICDWQDGLDPSRELIDRITKVYHTVRKHDDLNKPLNAGLLFLRIQVMETLSDGRSAEKYKSEIYEDYLAIRHHLTGSVHAFCLFNVERIQRSAKEISERIATGQTLSKPGRSV